MKQENMLPINAMYLSWLRDIGYKDRSPAIRGDKKAKVITVIKTEMDVYDMVIYLMLLTRADNKTLKCRPSIKTISEDCRGIDRITVIEHLNDLKEMGFIDVKKKRGAVSEYFMKDFHEWRSSMNKHTTPDIDQCE
ncbi:MAG: helix-turn-helix domain-containing protein [Desulfuromonadaceae bacterium]